MWQATKDKSSVTAQARVKITELGRDAGPRQWWWQLKHSRSITGHGQDRTEAHWPAPKLI